MTGVAGDRLWLTFDLGLSDVALMTSDVICMSKVIGEKEVCTTVLCLGNPSVLLEGLYLAHVSHRARQLRSDYGR